MLKKSTKSSDGAKNHDPMKNSIFIILLTFIIIKCSDWNTKPLVKCSQSHTIWHYALKDSLIIQFEIDSIFHLTNLKSIWDGSTASYGYEYQNSSLIISYYPLPTFGNMLMYERVISSQRTKIKDAYPERTITKSERLILGTLDGVYTVSNDSKIKEITYQGVDQKNQIGVHILFTMPGDTSDFELILRELIYSMKFYKKNG